MHLLVIMVHSESPKDLDPASASCQMSISPTTPYTFDKTKYTLTADTRLRGFNLNIVRL